MIFNTILHANDDITAQDPQQWLIKIVLIAILAIIALFIVIPGRGTRGQALQRITWLFAIMIGVIAIIFPALTTAVANTVGIGRGTDMLFYLLIVFFIGHVLLATRRQTMAERDITRLARKIALLEAEIDPENAKVNISEFSDDRK
ncbi:MAG: DUF2304 domain-containing protein [Microbacteriaceae bacterium]|nr:DUF2304 domain-containing protein [Microbacteriaceae bacterium]